MKISFSQISDFEKCRRRWFLERIVKLVVAFDAKHLAFGTCLHGVIERYLAADHTGRVPSPVPKPLEGQTPGDNVNLYPPGWHEITEKGSTIRMTAEQQEHIKWLIDAAINDGVLFRVDGADIERYFHIPLTDETQLVGKIDYSGAGFVTDQKSYGQNSSKYLLKSEVGPRYVGDDNQMLTYAVGKQVLDDEDCPVKLRHQRFPSFHDGTRPSAVEATVSAERVRKHMSWLVEIAQEMEKVAAVSPEDWRKVPGPSDANLCSRWYGKMCPMAELCSGLTTMEKFNARRKPWDMAAARAEARTKKTNETKPMSLFKRTPKPSITPSLTPSEPLVPGGEPARPAPMPASTGANPPWADPECPACKGRGLVGKSGCPLCDRKAKAGTGAFSGCYAFETDGKAVLKAKALPAYENTVKSAGWPLEWAPGAVAVVEPVQKAPETAWVDAETGEEPQEKPKGRRGRPKGSKNKPKDIPEGFEERTATIASAPLNPDGTLAGSFVAAPAPKIQTGDSLSGWGSPMLFLDCAPSRGATVTIQEVLAHVGGPDYWNENAFARRDKVRQNIAKAYEFVAGRAIVCRGGSDPDTSVLVGAFLSNPDMVVVS